MSDSTIRSAADEEWDDLLRQLHRQPQAQPRPFFYGRVRARLTADAPAPRPLLAGLRRPAYAVLLAALVLSLSGDGSAFGSGRAAATAAQPATGQPPR